MGCIFVQLGMTPQFEILVDLFILRFYFQVHRCSFNMQIIGQGLFLYFACLTHVVTTTVTINLKKKNLTKVPTNLPTNLTNLNIAENFLSTLKADSFPKYTKLSNLTVSHNGLEVIRDGTFDQQIQLRYLYLSHNNIRQLPSYFGPSVTGLVTWDIYGGYETTAIFTHSYFDSFTRLQILYLGGLYVETFQDPSMLPGSLEIFYLSHSILTTLPDLSNTSNLHTLSFSNCEIEQIPQQHIDALINMKDLRFESNKITSMPNVSHMPLLVLLSLNDNRLQGVPRSHISGLVSLKWLYLRNNVLHIMPNISYLTNIEYINLSENDITGVPASTMKGIPNLLTLKLNDNKISVLGDISPLWAHVYLANNNLSTLPDLYNMRLETLTLEGNPLSCDQSLCWLRMWPWNKTLPALDDAYCSTPSNTSVSRAMGVHPTYLHCFNGMTAKMVSMFFCGY